ncbi:hypothetical protein [Bdellovibrio sp. HCB337]|uniref:hypothetical protein n=1 Tax=Bdellovibrio sp. HCB337 TaxID=3394358 RepID=UPI0039A56307
MMGPQSRTPRYSNDDKNLIAEQPGRLVLFSGVLLAVTLGLIARGLTSPNKVKSMIESAAARIHKDIRVDFEGAQMSLANGIMPRFAVVITQVKMESENECWMKPRLTADEIRLPLSFWALLQGQNPITQVEAGQVAIDLRSAYKNCEENPKDQKSEAPKIKQFVTLKQAPGSGHKTTPPPQVNAILVDRLKISAPNLTEAVDLNAFAVRLKSHAPRVVEVTAKTHLMKDDQVGDYLSHATVWGEYSEFPRNTLQARISGNWREGSYHVKASYDMKSENLLSELDLKHVPLSQATQILKKFQWLKDDVNARQIWVSLNAQAEITKSNFKTAQMQLKDLRLEGDLGDLTINEARVVSFDPVKYFPFTIDLRRVSLEKLLGLMNKSHPSPILGQLGTFTGSAQITDANNVEIKGVQKGLEFIFSNKGQRELQALSEIATNMKLEKDRWNIQISRFVPEQGTFDGALQVMADKEFKNLEVKAKANEIRLAPNVVRLMTGGGEFGAFSGDLAMKFAEGQMSYIRGHLNSESFNIEGVEVSKAKLNIDYSGGEAHAQTQVQKMAVNVGSPAFQILKDLIEPDWMIDNRLQMKSLNAQFNAKSFKILNWKNFSAQLDKGGRLLSDGEWNENGILSGQVQAQAGKVNHKWLISGQRDEPIFTLVDAAKKKK